VSAPGVAATQPAPSTQGRPEASAQASGDGGVSGSTSTSAFGAGNAQAGAQNGAGGDARGSAPGTHAPRAGSAAQIADDAAASQPGALVGALSQTSSTAAGSEASPLPGAAVGETGSASASAATGAAPTLASGVAMQDMIDSIRATIEIAARQGMTQARIALQPEDLGHISIRLSQTSAGLLARVSAETPAAAQALQAGRAELHQSLSSLGVSLLRLDINSFGQSQAGEQDGRFAGEPGASNASRAPGGSEEGDGSEPVGEPEGAAARATIAGGELVDVLA
jgi:flagellar hook-length control protein FliK